MGKQSHIDLKVNFEKTWYGMFLNVPEADSEDLTLFDGAICTSYIFYTYNFACFLFDDSMIIDRSSPWREERGTKWR